MIGKKSFYLGLNFVHFRGSGLKTKLKFTLKLTNLGNIVYAKCVF